MREALWGKAGAFDVDHPPCRAARGIAAVRAARPALRYGRQYFRPVSGDGRSFGISRFVPGVLAFSRILGEEVVVAANAGTDPAGVDLQAVVDAELNPAGSEFASLYSNKPGIVPGPVPVQRTVADRVEEVDGSVRSGPLHALRLSLRPGEVRILGR